MKGEQTCCSVLSPLIETSTLFQNLYLVKPSKKKFFLDPFLGSARDQCLFLMARGSLSLEGKAQHDSVPHLGVPDPILSSTRLHMSAVLHTQPAVRGRRRGFFFTSTHLRLFRCSLLHPSRFLRQIHFCHRLRRAE